MPSVAKVDLFDQFHLCRYFSQQSPEPMVAVEGPTHIVRYVNPAFSRLVNKSKDELLGRSFADAVPESSKNHCQAVLDRVFRTGKPECLDEQEHREQSLAFWSYSMWAIVGDDNNPAGVMVHVTDATAAAVFRRQAVAMNEALVLSSVEQHELIESIKRGEQERRDLESQLFHKQKVESLGVLAGGIAHDLNNMLTPVLGYAELASDMLPKGSPAIEMLDEVRHSGRRAADLVAQILAYAGKGQFVLQPLDLSALVRETAPLLEAAVVIEAAVTYELGTGLPAVEADLAQIRQVVINLVTNASEAMTGRGGVITIRTGFVSADNAKPSATTSKQDLPTGPSVFLEVEDTGSGMSADTIEKIFDPFFTTKFVGRGLGLAVVQGIARGHRGVLKVRSEPGEGSTFRILLPCLVEKVVSPVTSVAPIPSTKVGTIMVVEDEKSVRDITAHILKKAGFTVLLAGDGIEALEIFQTHRDAVDAVVSDMAMPRMGGLEVARELKALRPDLPIVLMSGFSVKEITLQSAGFGVAGFVQKPFNAVELVTTVRTALVKYSSLTE
jgi:PAS domain S-box-containing protein